MKKKAFVSMILLSTLSIHAQAGGADHVGNGGGLWSCRNGKGVVRSLQLVDLFEARSEFQLSVPSSGQQSMETLIDRIEKKLFAIDRHYSAEFERQLSLVRSRIKFLDGVKLKVVEDSLYRAQPGDETCVGGVVQYEQLANYTNDERIIVNQFLWKSPKLTNLDRAALYVHEAIYSLLRDKEGVKDSTKARKIVGYLFSTTDSAEYAYLLKLPAPPKAVVPVASHAPAQPAPVTPSAPSESVDNTMHTRPSEGLYELASGPSSCPLRVYVSEGTSTHVTLVPTSEGMASLSWCTDAGKRLRFTCTSAGVCDNDDIHTDSVRRITWVGSRYFKTAGGSAFRYLSP